LISLQIENPSVQFSCLIDNEKSAKEIATLAFSNNLNLPVWIDLNIGMGRTGIPVSEAYALYKTVPQ
jgi:alanine racemase